MRLLDRYLLRELLVPLGYCLCGFLIFWIFSDLFNELGEFQRKKLLISDVGEYYLITTPGFLVVVLPIALLLALLYTLTTHARHHEITAIRAAGVSLWRLSAPYFACGLVASSLLFIVNEFWVPDSAEAAEQVKSRHQPRAPGLFRQRRQLPDERLDFRHHLPGARPGEPAGGLRANPRNESPAGRS